MLGQRNFGNLYVFGTPNVEKNGVICIKHSSYTLQRVALILSLLDTQIVLG